MTTSLDQARYEQRNGKALLTGMLLGSMLKEQTNPDSPFKILDVRPLVDDNGNYLPRFEIDMPSGTYTVALIDADVIEEEP